MLRSRKRRRESVSLLSVTASSEDLPCEEKGAQNNVLKSVSSSCVGSFRPASGTSRRFSIENWGRNFMKRKIRKLSTSEHNPPSSCLPCDTKEDAKLSRFINWCSRNGITISEKVILSRNGSCGNIGMVASSAVSVGEQLAYIPRGTLLCAKNSSISQVMVEDEQFMKQLESASSWVPLLTALVYEWSKMNENGKWSPYLQLVPNPESLDPPMMWSKSERERLLSGTSLLSNVDNDLKDIQSDYDTIVKPFMQRHPEIFSKKLISFQLYQELVSFVMSYSFTEATSVMEEEETEERDILEATSMVPVIDLLNHHFRHHAELNARQHYLELIAVRDIAKGEEIMNTYGQHSNTSLLHMYGFALKGNPQDVVMVPAEMVLDAAIDTCRSNAKKIEGVQKRWRKLNEIGVYSHGVLLQIDSNGIPEEDMLKLLQLLLGKKEYFEEEVKIIVTTEEEDDSMDSSDSSSSDDIVGGSDGDEGGSDGDEGESEGDEGGSNGDEGGSDDDEGGSNGDEGGSDGHEEGSDCELVEDCRPKMLLFEEEQDIDFHKNVSTIYNLPVEIKKCIGRIIELQLSLYPESHVVTKQALHSQRTTPREKMAAIVCYGQQKCLLALLNHLEGSTDT